MFASRTNWQLAPNRFSRALEQQHRAARKLLDLTVSNPTRCGLQYDDGALLAALANPAALDYDPQPKGILHARAAVAEYYEARGIQIPLERIVLTTSTSEAYSFVFRLLCEPGDDVLVPQPSYPLFEFLAGICDVNLRPYELVYDHGWQVDFPSVEAALTPRTRAIMVVHPNNPTGSYVQPQERALLNELCGTACAIVADEVFLDYALDENARRESFAGNRDALTFTLSGVSKISALPQMKLAWMVIGGPEKMADEATARMEVIADTYLSMNWPIQLAAPALLGEGVHVQAQLTARVRENLAELDRQIAGTSLDRLAVEGGWYATLRVPVTRTDEDLAIELLEREGVIAHPGHFFDFHRDGYLVLSLITPVEEFAEGLRRIVRFMR